MRGGNSGDISFKINSSGFRVGKLLHVCVIVKRKVIEEIMEQQEVDVPYGYYISCL